MVVLICDIEIPNGVETHSSGRVESDGCNRIGRERAGSEALNPIVSRIHHIPQRAKRKRVFLE